MNAPFIRSEARNREGSDDGDRLSARGGQFDGDVREPAAWPHDDLCVDELPTREINRGCYLDQLLGVEVNRDVIVSIIC